MTPLKESFHLDTVAAVPSTGPAVLCLPGLFAGSWVFERLLPLIAEHEPAKYDAAAVRWHARWQLEPLVSTSRVRRLHWPLSVR